MTTFTRNFSAIVIAVALSMSSFAQSARDVLGPTTFVPLANEPPPKLIVDPPLPDRLAHGAVVIQYRVENFHLVPVFGAAALDVSPRVGHLHVAVDDLP